MSAWLVMHWRTVELRISGAGMVCCFSTTLHSIFIVFHFFRSSELFWFRRKNTRWSHCVSRFVMCSFSRACYVVVSPLQDLQSAFAWNSTWKSTCLRWFNGRKTHHGDPAGNSSAPREDSSIWLSENWHVVGAYRAPGYLLRRWARLVWPAN